MSEWHIAPDYIVNNWPDELLLLMIEKLTERKQQEREAIEGHRKVKDTTLFSRARNLIKVKHGD